MANYPSSVKRHRQAPRRRGRNRLIVGDVRAALKRARTAIAGGAGDKAALVQAAIQAVDKAVSKGAMRRPTASRTISRLQTAFNAAK
jgi:small subunit ribosomal protein S20